MHQPIEGYRISQQQQRRWVLHHVHPVSIRSVVRLTGFLQESRLQAAIQHVVSQQHILCTTLHHIPSRKIPVQTIDPAAHFFWDVQSCAKNEIDDIVRAFLEQNTQGDSELAPLVCRLLVVEPDEHLLLLHMSGLCADLPTMYLFIEQVAEAYAGSSLQKEEPVQYIQFSEWQYQLLTEESEEAAMGARFWEQYQWSKPAEIALPYATYSLSSSPLYHETVPCQIEPSLLSELQRLAERYEVNLPSVLLSAWQALLWRLTGQDRVCIGYVSTGREPEELQNVCGPLSATLPVSCTLTHEMHFHELLQQTEIALQEVAEWQDYLSWPGEQDASYFFPLNFAYFECSQSSRAAGVLFQLEKCVAYEEPFALKLFCLHTNDALSISLCYDRSLFSTDQMDYTLSQYHQILHSIVQRPGSMVARIEVRGAKELLPALASKDPLVQAPYPCVQELFENQAECVPDALALVCTDQAMTYAALNVRANQLARFLQGLGVSPETLVGVGVEQSVETIIALLGILKAGGAFVPLDMNQPEQRLASQLNDLPMAFILIQPTQRFPFERKQCQIIDLHEKQAQIMREEGANLSLSIDERNLAYIVFTSGSTGKPKGTAIEQRQLAHYLASIQNNLHVSGRSTYALTSSLVADLGYTQLFSALCFGNRLHVLTEDQFTSAEVLSAYIDAHSIDCIKIVPSHLQALLTAASRPHAVLPRRQLILGGESSAWSLVQKVRELAPDCAIFNHYGPTETTIGVMTYAVPPSFTGLQPKTLPLDQPLAGTTIYLLDPYYQPVPVGAIGEIYIGGESVGRGYLAQPERTAERFVPNPFSSRAGERLYKTGDLACLLTDTAICIVGRNDDQVKFHGYRLELNEIRSALNQHLAIEDSVVTLQKDEQGRAMLIAYYVARAALSPLELRAWLTKWIPEEICPNTYIHLTRLPLRPNGKINYQALPTIEDAQREKKRTRIAPRTPLEEALFNIWVSVLHIEHIGVEDNFFELWGDSILGIQMIAAAANAGIGITLKQLFEHPTIAELATVVTAHTESPMLSPVAGPVPLTPIQHWFFAQDLPDFNHWGIAVVLEVAREINLEAIEQTFEYLYRLHPMLRSCFTHSEAGWSCEIIDVQDAHFSLLRYECLDGVSAQDNAAAAFLRDPCANLNLAQGPLIQAVYLDYGAEKASQLWIVIHRLLVDGYSWRLLVEQFYTLYLQIANGQQGYILAEGTSYQRWAEHLLAYARAEQLQQELDYWLNNPDWQHISPLSMDKEVPEERWSLREAVATTLSAEETRHLLQETLSVYNAEIMVILLTALTCMCAHWTDGHLWAVDLESHGREELFDELDLSRTVGWFTALFPFLLAVDDTADPVVVLKQVKERLSRLPHHGIGYGVLRYLSPDAGIRRALAALPTTELHFRYTGQFRHLGDQQILLIDQQEPPLLTQHYRLEVVCSIFDERLHLSIFYSEKMYHRETIERLAHDFLDVVRTLIARAMNADTVLGLTASDFPLAGLNQQELEDLMLRLSQEEI